MAVKIEDQNAFASQSSCANFSGETSPRSRADGGCTWLVNMSARLNDLISAGGSPPFPTEHGLAGECLSSLYEDLKSVARRHLRCERIEHTLQPTALLHEALLRVGGFQELRASNPREFCAVASKLMRLVLVDHARKKNALKRGGMMIRIDIDQQDLPAANVPIADLLDLDSALNDLARLNQRHADVVQLRFFASLTVEETASVLQVSRATVKNDWRIARAWLLSRLHDRDER